nr:hypothetical protein BgiMline_033642 [Biomphalaria glabrata]
MEESIVVKMAATLNIKQQVARDMNFLLFSLCSGERARICLRVGLISYWSTDSSCEYVPVSECSEGCWGRSK